MAEGRHTSTGSEASGGWPFLSGGGEAGRLVAAHDWSGTSVGPLADWPASLRSAVALMLRSQVPMVILWGAGGVMIYNDGYGVVAGSRHPEILGAEVREAWPEVAAFNDHVMKECLAGRTLAYRDQLMTLNRGGAAERVWFNLDYSPITDEAGAPVAVLAIVVETTGKVRAERQLRGEQDRLRQMFEQAPGLIAMLEGPDHVFTLANEAILGFLGRCEVVGRPVREAVPEVVAQGFVATLDEVRRTGVSFVGQAVPVTLEPTPGTPLPERYVDFVFQPVVDEDGAVSGIFVEGHDVTDRRRADSVLRESEERFRLVAENAPVMLWMGDETGGCSYLNAAQRAYWGVAPEQIAGFDWGTTVHPEDRDTLQGPLESAMRAHVPFTVESRLRRADGVYRQIRTNAQPRFGADGGFLGMIGVNVDVTETRKSEAALKTMNEALEERVVEALAERSRAEEALRQAQKLEAVGKLTGGVAHDFNNLLQVISGNLQLLARDVAGRQRAEDRVAEALAGVRQGARLASQLLAFSRRQPLEPKVVNIGRLVSGMGEMLRRTIGDGVEVETVAADGLWNTLVDPGQLETAVLNLAINARDAMNAVGKLTIEAGNASLDEAYAREHDDVTAGQYAVLTVTDTGGGIAPELLDQVFEPFFSTKPQGKGTGLGLSMVYGFVKQSGGHVNICSEPGQGTAVKLYLPRIRQSEDAPPVVEAGPVTGGTETILVAEDNDGVRATAVDMLADLGYRVLTAKDAAGALGVIDSGAAVDLLFTDIVMPGPLRSTELARMARERLPGIGVLFTSGYAENSIVHGGRLDAGIELLSKPYTREALARRVRAVLARSGRARAPARGVAGLRVLVCEDDALIRLHTADVLQDAGATVVEAGSGAEALARLDAAAAPDALVIDVGLPDMTGVELARRIRERLPEVPIVFATGHAEVPGIEGMARVETIRKPHDESELRASITRLVSGG